MSNSDYLVGEGQYVYAENIEARNDPDFARLISADNDGLLTNGQNVLAMEALDNNTVAYFAENGQIFHSNSTDNTPEHTLVNTEDIVDSFSFNDELYFITNHGTSNPFQLHKNGAATTLNPSYEIQEDNSFVVGEEPNVFRNVGQTTGSGYGKAQQFILSENTYLRNVKVTMYKVGSPDGNVTCKIYDNTDGNGTLLATATNTISAASLTASTSGQEYTFTFNTDYIGSSNIYVLFEKTGTIDVSNHVAINALNGQTAP